MLILGMGDMPAEHRSTRERAPSAESGEREDAPPPAVDPVEEGVDALKKLLPF
jgi:hypothetical protein